jgi:hypothetical protein
MRTDSIKEGDLLLREMNKAIRNILVVAAFIFIGSFGSKAQSKKNTAVLYEYQSAFYNAVSQEVYICLKDESGSSRQFIYNPADTDQSELILFNPINTLIGNSNVLTKTELVGNKFDLTFTSLNGSAPEGTCCFKITSCVPQ